MFAVVFASELLCIVHRQGHRHCSRYIKHSRNHTRQISDTLSGIHNIHLHIPLGQGQVRVTTNLWSRLVFFCSRATASTSSTLGDRASSRYSSSYGHPDWATAGYSSYGGHHNWASTAKGYTIWSLRTEKGSLAWGTPPGSLPSHTSVNV